MLLSQPSLSSSGSHLESLKQWQCQHACASVISSTTPFRFIFLLVTPRGTWILVPLPGIKPTPPAVEFRSLNHWTTSQGSPIQVLLGSFFLKNKFIYLFLAALGLRCCARAFSRCSKKGLLFVAERELLIAVTSLVTEHGLQAHGLQQLQHVGSVVVASGLQSTGSVVVAHGFSCSSACGIFLDQGSNPCPLLWQADS